MVTASYILLIGAFIFDRYLWTTSSFYASGLLLLHGHVPGNILFHVKNIQPSYAKQMNYLRRNDICYSCPSGGESPIRSGIFGHLVVARSRPFLPKTVRPLT